MHGDPSTAAKLSAIMGTMIVPIDGGFRVKQTETHWIDVLEMLFNWRVVRTPKARPLTWDRGWHYAGGGLDGLLRAVAAAVLWDGADDTEPEGWIKNVLTGERRPPGA